MLNSEEWIYSNPDSKPMCLKKNNLIPFINYRVPAPERCLDMLLKKYRGESYQSEVVMTAPEQVAVPYLNRKLKDARILLVTDGGLVPTGNPDNIPSTCAGRFGVYSFEGEGTLRQRDYEVTHQGYNFTRVEEDPNRLLPVDALRQLEKEGVIQKLHETFLSTTGVMTPVNQSIGLGERIAAYVKKLPIDAVILTSACGTSTRCGAYIGLAIEKAGIPVVQITNLTKIAADTGLTRVVQGNNVCHPLGNPSLPPSKELLWRRVLVEESLQLLSLQECRNK